MNNATQSSRPLRAATHLACIAMLAGCATNPYSTVEPASPDHDYGDGYKVIGIAGAMHKLSEYREDYRAKRSAEFDRQQYLSTGIFGFGALALALGAYGAHRDAVTGVAIAGATTYQTGMWNTSPGRNDIYAAAIEALDCGESIMGPAMTAATRYTAVIEAREELESRQKALLKSRGALQAVILTQSLNPATKSDYQNLVDSAAADAGRASQIAAKANTWRALVVASGQSLSTFVTKVNSDVDKALKGTLADPSKLGDSVEGLGSYLKLFSGIAATGSRFSSVTSTATTRSGGGGTTESGQLPGTPPRTAPGATEVRQLLNDQAELSSAIDRLGTSMSGASLANPGNKFAGCKGDISKAAPALQADPADIELSAGVQYEKHVRVLNSSGIFRAVLMDVTPNGITVNQTMGDTFSIVVGPKSAVGTYQISVTDNVATTIVSVRLSAQPSGGADTGRSEARQGKKAPLCAAGFTNMEMCLVQKFLGVTIDANPQEETCTTLMEKTGKRVFDKEVLANAKKKYALPDAATEAEMGAKLGTQCTGSAFKWPPAPAPAASASPGVVAPVAGPTQGAPALDSVCAPIPQLQTCSVTTSRCVAECALSRTQVGQLRTALGLAATPAEFDKALRDKLAEKQKMLGLPATGNYYGAMKAPLGFK